MKTSKFISFLSIVSLCILATLLNSCAPSLSSHVYSSHMLEEAPLTMRGVVVNVRSVLVQNNDNPSGVGMLAGGVAGGVIGNQFGKGNGNSIATVAGALLGAAAGANAEQSAVHDAYEYVVQLENGEMRTIVQGNDVLLLPGQAILLIASQYGRSRIIPDQTVIYQVPR